MHWLVFVVVRSDEKVLHVVHTGPFEPARSERQPKRTVQLYGAYRQSVALGSSVGRRGRIGSRNLCRPALGVVREDKVDPNGIIVKLIARQLCHSLHSWLGGQAVRCELLTRKWWRRAEIRAFRAASITARETPTRAGTIAAAFVRAAPSFEFDGRGREVVAYAMRSKQLLQPTILLGKRISLSGRVSEKLL